MVHGAQVGSHNTQYNTFQGVAPPWTDLDTACRKLAQMVNEQWRGEATARGIATPAPATVRWRWGETDVAADPADVAATKGAGPLTSGTVNRLHDEVYARLSHGRLVLLGRPGAGKTAAMILLLIAALEHRGWVPEPASREIPVPVWLTMGGWDPVSTSLTDWAIETVARDLSPRTAAELVNSGRAALYLDGLDEMPPASRGAALRRIDETPTHIRIVLTSRRDEYREALETGRLHGAAVVELQPVKPSTAARYLGRDQVGVQRERWRVVGAYLRSHPLSAATQALNNPLTLTLARDTYRYSDPVALVDTALFPTPAAVRAHLIERLMDQAYPDARNRERAGRFLGWIARNLGDNRDIAWWRLSSSLPRSRLVVSTALRTGAVASALTLLLLLAANMWFRTGSGLPAGDFLTAYWARLVPGMMLLVWVTGWMIGGRASDRLVGPKTLRPSVPGRREIARLLGTVSITAATVGLVGALMTRLGDALWATYRHGVVDGPGLMSFLSVGYDAAVRVFLLTLAVVGLPIGVALGLYDLWAVPADRATAASPRSTFAESRRSSLQACGGLGALAAAGTAFPVALTAGAVPGLALGVAVGWFFAYAVWIASPPGILRFVEVTARGLSRRPRLLDVLDLAHRRQVLRQAGSVYQFRHAEVQDQMATGQRARPAGHRRRLARRPAVAAVVVAVLGLSAALAVPLARAQPDHLTIVPPSLPENLVFSRDGSLLAASGADTTVIVDTGTGRQVKRVRGTALAFTPDGRSLISMDQQWLHWIDLATGTTARSLAVGIDATSIQLASDQRTVVALFEEAGEVGIWEAPFRTGPRILSPWTSQSSSGGRHIHLSPDGRLIATAGGDRVNLWNVARRSFVRTLAVEWAFPPVFSRDSTEAATMSRSNTLIVESVPSGKRVSRHALPDVRTIQALAPDWTMVVSGTPGYKDFSGDIQLPGTLFADGLASRAKSGDLARPSDRIRYAEFSPDGSRLATVWGTGLEDNTRRLRVWNADRWRNTVNFDLDLAEINSLAFSPDSGRLAVGWTDGRVRVWRLTA
ncbi:hypothetical protein AB0M02_37735 [Actinoplanes sp. NPDC051861]|uniref:hypothetical protein n=1 Tax=Actinoplanes sp. NPDC051861 TaxID=3155170 RepID=UPI003430B87C